MWRYDSNRSADSPGKLPARLSLHWTRVYEPRTPAWEDPLNRDLMPFDSVFEPIVLGDRMFVPFNDRDKLVALDIRTGRELWTFHADGPVRLAPAAWGGRVYFVSDDGHLYCVRAEDGGLEWKHRAAPSESKVLGNSRLISAWPARGGPVIREGVVYFAASIWPFMGTLIHALDAETGRVVWINDGTGADYIKQPHNAPAFAGVAPQGALVATEKLLLVPGGRSIPAAFERATGRFLYFHIAESGKGTGGSTVMANEETFFAHTRGRGVRAHELETGARTLFTINEPVLGRNHYYCAADHPSIRGALSEAEATLEAARYGEIKARAELNEARGRHDEQGIERASKTLASAEKKVMAAEETVARARAQTPRDAMKNVVQSWRMDQTLAWEIEADGSGDLIRAGRRLYAGGAGAITAIDLPKAGANPEVAWTLPVPGRIGRFLAAGGMLFAVTQEGNILAFGEERRAPAETITDRPNSAGPSPEAIDRALALVARTGANEGYALCLGVDSSEDLAAMAAVSALHIVGVDPDEAKIARFRRELDAAGLYGRRVTLLAARPDEFGAPPYIASLIMVGSGMTAALSDPAALGAIYESVRPYGGSIVFAAPSDAVGLATQARSANLANARIESVGEDLRIVREGALPGAADWTHQYGNSANTVKSDDHRVRLPLGVLWFGGNTHMDVLPRHGHGPAPQIVGGRLFIQGVDGFSARDVYTGRRLWKTSVPELNTRGIYYDDTLLGDPLTTLYNQRHIPGANARGSNFVATDDVLYIAVSNRCVLVNAVTGQIETSIEMPAPEWAFIAVSDNVLLGGTGFAHFNRRFANPDLAFLSGLTDVAASAGLAAFDRRTGRMLWRVDARHGFFHNGIVVGGGRVYCLDMLPASVERKARSRGETPGAYRIVAHDLQTGVQLWEQTDGIFGTWLSYSESHDLLLQAGASAADRLRDEVGRGMAVLRAEDGAYVWRNDAIEYNGPCILHHDLIITTPRSYTASAGAFSLLDGKPHSLRNPLTGELQPWRVHRTYGCNTPVASEHLMTFRSGAAGFYDLAMHGGTGNLGGFKSGCSASLIVANGVLNAPDYTRTCSCPYQNQTSLAFVPMPETELWTSSHFGLDMPPGLRIVRAGLNLGAPGDRLDEDGTLWLETPFGERSVTRLPVTIQPGAISPYRRHASAVAGEGHAWVVASGLRDIESIQIRPQSMLADAPSTPKGSPRLRSSEAQAAPVAPLPPAKYTVRLYFLEPDTVSPGDRVFDVLLQGRPVLTGFDIIEAAGAQNTGIVREFIGVSIAGELDVRFRKAPSSKLGANLSGIELILE